MVPTTDLMKKGEFRLTQEAEGAIILIKKLLTKAPCLALPHFEILLEVESDASKSGIGAILSQEKRPACFYSEKVLDAPAKYSTYDVELYSVMHALQFGRHLMLPK